MCVFVCVCVCDRRLPQRLKTTLRRVTTQKTEEFDVFCLQMYK